MHSFAAVSGSFAIGGSLVALPEALGEPSIAAGLKTIGLMFALCFAIGAGVWYNFRESLSKPHQRE